MAFWTRQTKACKSPSVTLWDAECRSAAPKTLQGMKCCKERGVSGLGAQQRIGETGREKVKKKKKMSRCGQGGLRWNMWLA